jgi:hypothetical protein
MNRSGQRKQHRVKLVIPLSRDPVDTVLNEGGIMTIEELIERIEFCLDEGVKASELTGAKAALYEIREILQEYEDSE